MCTCSIFQPALLAGDAATVNGTAVLFYSTLMQATASMLQQAESTWAAVLMIVILNAETVCHP